MSEEMKAFESRCAENNVQRGIQHMTAKMFWRWGKEWQARSNPAASPHLQAENVRLREALAAPMIGVMVSLTAAISLLERSPKIGIASSEMFDIVLNDYKESLEVARAALRMSGVE